jgi:two-component system phosphate regulon sensor histidine kinase PhoR
MPYRPSLILEAPVTGMFRRLFVAFVLPVLTALAVLALVIASLASHDLRLRLTGALAGAAAVALTVAFFLAARMARNFSRRVRELTRAAESLSDGAVGRRVFNPADDDIGKLGQAFNRMSERLGTRLIQLEEDRQQLRTILSGMVEGVVALDAEQRILFANDRATQLLELPAQMPVGRRLWEVVRHRSLLDTVQHALASPEPQRQEISWNGWAVRNLTVHAARLPGLPPRGAVLVVHDTSELRRLERLRQEFVANVSHELKTPLSVIKICTETLLDGAVDDLEHRGHFLEQIVGQSERLHALILDLLSLARIEAGTELFHFKAVPVEEVIQAAIQRYYTRAEAHKQTLVLVTPDGTERSIDWEGELDETAAWADEEAIDQILDNLLDNALKYTPEGGQIRVSWRADGEQVCLEVADTGIGIPEADLPRIFERFYRVDKARSREMGGTGLGLSIVKHLAQAMHGSVRASSRIGEGTTFAVCLPLAPDDKGKEPGHGASVNGV